LERNSFDEWLRIKLWKMTVPFAYKFKAELMKFAQNTKARFKEVEE